MSWYRFRRFLLKLVNTVDFFFRYGTNVIYVNCWIHQRSERLRPRNLGDELNVYLIEQMTGKKVLSCQCCFPLRRARYLVIGSVLEAYSDKWAVVWGTGAMYGGDMPFSVHSPAKVCAVRGKLTREYLLNNGVDCPEVYGDPALLLPYYYKPNVGKIYRYGIIPHWSQMRNGAISDLCSTLGESTTTIISMHNYSDWHEVIDKINQCEYIISTSLHGLILADAYGIPNVYAKCADPLEGQDFKFRDYFSGVGRGFLPAIEIEENPTVEIIAEYLTHYKPIDFDMKGLVETCPFELNFNSCINK